jgi:histone deacetylase complex regulatory component SIN3
VLGRSKNAENWSRVQLSDIRVTGKDVTIFLNRNLLSKALRFGLTRIDIIDSRSPLRFANEGRQMIVMPTRPDAPSPSQNQQSPADPEPEAPTATSPPPAEQPESKTTMPKSENGNGSHNEPVDKPVLETALQQVEGVKTSIKSAVSGLNELLDTLKQAQREQKNTDKEVQSVRTTLEKLQSVKL